MENYKQIIESQRTFFNTNQTKDLKFRIAQLKSFKRMILENEADFYTAIKKDFHKSEFDTFSSELSLILHDIKDAIKNLRTWSARKRQSTNLVNFPAKSFVIPEPLGVCLVIGAWNYPFQLSLSPAVAAIAAGNTVVLKPSEIPSETSKLMATLIGKYFKENIFTVVEGGVEETTALLKVRFDKIFFTGSATVGKIIYKQAAEHLTPVTLELGGKSPAIITESVNMGKTVQRLVWAKFLNAGQTCIAPDYVFVHKSKEVEFIQKVKEEITKRKYALENDNYVQIINTKNFERLEGLITKDKLIFGGEIDTEKRTIEPTLLKNVSFDHPCMQEEIFGPILPIISYSNLDEVINYVKRNEKPLSAYIFSNSREVREKLLNEISFGGGCVNEAVMHITNSKLPFGGVGASGMGAYHGKAGFDCFSHQKSILHKANWLETPIKYSPISITKLKLVKRIFKLS